MSASARTCLLLALALAYAAFTTGCATATYPSSSNAPAIGTVGTVSYGKVVKVRPFVTDGQSTRLGRHGGALIGGALGTGVGGDLTSTATAMAVGLVLGEWVGGRTEAYLNRQRAEELIIQTEAGHTIVVAQVGSPTFAEGDEVEIFSYHGRVHVAHRY